MSLDGTLLGNEDPAHMRSLFVSDVVEEIRVVLNPVILGGRSGKCLTGFLTGELGGFLPEDRQFRLKGMEEINGKMQLHYIRDRRKRV